MHTIVLRIGAPVLLFGAIALPTPLLAQTSSFTETGKVYYSDTMAGKPWNRGVFTARYSATGFLNPSALDKTINSEFIDYTPYISPDESYLMFSSSRPSAQENMFLYISFKNPDGTWSVPRRMNEALSFSGNARFPSISPDGKYLFFCGDDGNFYWVDSRVIEQLRPDGGSWGK